MPDLLGCIAAGQTPGRKERLIRDPIVLHLECLCVRHSPISEPGTQTGKVEVSVQPN